MVNCEFAGGNMCQTMRIDCTYYVYHYNICMYRYMFTNTNLPILICTIVSDKKSVAKLQHMFGIGYSCFIAGVLLPIHVYKYIYVYKPYINTKIHLLCFVVFFSHFTHFTPCHRSVVLMSSLYVMMPRIVGTWENDFVKIDQWGVGLSDGCYFGYFEVH